MQTEIIKDWFETVPTVHQADIAIFTMVMLENDFDMMTDADEAIETLKTWLTPKDEFEYRTLGKALSFVAVFEKFFGGRFSEDSWKMTRELFEAMLAKHPDSQSAKDGLATLPERQSDWKKIGESWEAAKAQISFEVPVSRATPPQV